MNLKYLRETFKDIKNKIFVSNEVINLHKSILVKNHVAFS